MEKKLQLFEYPAIWHILHWEWCGVKTVFLALLLLCISFSPLYLKIVSKKPFAHLVPEFESST